MCTLIIGRNVLAPDSVILAGNRDEDPGRPSRGPGVLGAAPRIVGGSDAVAGGTWLAVRERRAAVAMLNRRMGDSDTPAFQVERSRGLLTLDVAALPPPPHPEISMTSLVRDCIGRARYAPFNLVFATPRECLAFSLDSPDDRVIIRDVTPGWHVLTHRDMDDPQEPRAFELTRVLRDWSPKHLEDAREGLMELLASHEPPRVCIHTGRMVTVSSFVVWLTAHEARYHHLDGRPCEGPLIDHTDLLDGSLDGEPA